MLDPAAERARKRRLVRYATAIDTRDYALLDDVFTPTARLDFREAGGIEGRLSEVTAWLEREMARFSILQHAISNLRALDAAGSRTVCYVRAVHGYREDGALRFFELGGEYHDRWVETPAGPKIDERVLVRRFFLGDVPRPGA